MGVKEAGGGCGEFGDVTATSVSVPGRRRAWRWVALAAVLLVLCSIPAAVLVWFVKGTLNASQGAGSPLAAAVGVLDGVDRWADEDAAGVVRYMSSGHGDEVRARVVELRRQLLQGGTLASLEPGQQSTAAQSDDRVIVTLDVRARVQMDGGMSVYGEWHPWMFGTVRERWPRGGWKVDAHTAPDVCDTYLRCSG